MYIYLRVIGLPHIPTPLPTQHTIINPIPQEVGDTFLGARAPIGIARLSQSLRDQKVSKYQLLALSC